MSLAIHLASANVVEDGLQGRLVPRLEALEVVVQVAQDRLDRRLQVFERIRSAS